MSRQGVSALELAKRIGISQNYIAKRLPHEASFTFNDVENIATALAESRSQTWSRAGERPRRSPAPLTRLR